MVLIIDDDLELNVSEINPTRRVPSEWKWTWESDGRLVNHGNWGYVCFDDASNCYYSGQDYASCRTLAHNDEPNEFAEYLAMYE